VMGYCEAQARRAEEMRSAAPRLVAAVKGLNKAKGVVKREELTSMSYFLQHLEGISRDAKVEWLAARGCSVFSLQHDGIMASLTIGDDPVTVAGRLGVEVSRRVGYTVEVAVKSWPIGDDRLAYGRRPALRETPSHPRPVASADPGPEHRPELRPLSERAKVCFAKAMGSAKTRAAERLVLPGPDQLTVDGSTRRVVMSYKKDLAVGERTWAERVVGGHHTVWAGRGGEWLKRVREKFVIADSGRLMGSRSDPDCPLAAQFWWECDKLVQQQERNVGVSESRFVLDKLLCIEAEYPVTHFVASDGSRKEAEDEEGPRVGRVAFAVSKEGVRVMGGRLAHNTRDFERHSFEAEIAAFHDHLADTEGTFTVFITDCLSGSQAGGKFKSRTDAHKAACYRGLELDNINSLEARHLGVVYLWVHSHVGITPNEAADILADKMRDRKHINELKLVPSRFQLARVRGVKRGVGQAVYDMALGMLVEALAEQTVYTLMPNAGTWQVMVSAPHKTKLLREADFNTLSDGRANRCGLLADRVMNDAAPEGAPGSAEEAWRRREYRPSRSSWEWYRQTHCACPHCGPGANTEAHCQGLYETKGGGEAPRLMQSRWHSLVECRRGEVGAEVNDLREAASAWLLRRLDDFDMDAHFALRALQGGGAGLSRAERWAAMRFMLGVPMTPPDEAKADDRGLAAGYSKGFLTRMCRVLRAGVHSAQKATWGSEGSFRDTIFARFGRGAILLSRPGARAVEGAKGETVWLQGGRQAWVRKRGLHEQWQGREWSRKTFAKLREWMTRAGPRNSRMRARVAREASLGVMGAEERRAAAKGREDVAVGEGHRAFDDWALVRAMARWRMEGRGPGEGGSDKALATGAARRLVWLRHAGLDPGPLRARIAAAERRSEEVKDAEVRATVERLVRSVALGVAPSLQRLGESKASKMGRRDLADALAQVGKGPIAGGKHMVEKVLDVRRVGAGLQVLLRWVGAHDDSWRPWAACNPLARHDARILEKRKLPPRPAVAAALGAAAASAAAAARVRGVRHSSRLVHPPAGVAARAWRIRMADGSKVSEMALTPQMPAYSPGPAVEQLHYGQGAGRSKRGLPILMDSPGVEELRGVLWQTSPGSVREPSGPAKRRGSSLAGDAMAKKRREGT
jgi:hypothetical protein